MKQWVVRLLTWVGSHEVSVLVAFAGVAAGILIFGELADQVVDGGTKGIDQHLLLGFRALGTSQPFSENMEVAARDITALGGVLVLSMLTMFIVCYLALDGKRGMATFIFGSVFGGMAVSALLKDVFQRPRPELVPHLQYVAHSSFPSGHSMMSAVTYLTLAALIARSQKSKALKAFVLLAASLVTLLVGTSRVYLGVHWPSDVLAGWIAGSVWAVVCWLIARSLQEKKKLEPEGEATTPAT